MTTTCSRRTVLGWVPLGVAGVLGLSRVPRALAQDEYEEQPLHSYFPRTNPKHVSDTVRYSHFDLDKVRALVEAHPSLANAAVDWGFGDWESAIGAAAHMGRVDIAEVLLGNGARPDLFTHAMLGHLDVVRATVAAQPGIQSELGPHGITLLSHARAGKEPAEAVVAYLESVGGADDGQKDIPLAAAETAYLGTYRWGSHADEVFTIVKNKFGLGIKGAKGSARTLKHSGDSVFAPVGAPAVRVAFKVVDDIAMECNVFDGELLAAGRRESG